MMAVVGTGLSLSAHPDVGTGATPALPPAIDRRLTSARPEPCGHSAGEMLHEKAEALCQLGENGALPGLPAQPSLSLIMAMGRLSPFSSSSATDRLPMLLQGSS
jgi:hypothetical protein